MAEYFPLLDRAVSGLTEPTAEARRSIYERARTALIGQLGRMDPPVPEEDIARESAALDEAIARVEAKFPDHGHAPAAEAAPAALPPTASAAIPAPSTPSAPSAPSARVPPPLPTGAPPIVPPPSRERPVLGPRPAGGGAPAIAPVASARPALGPASRPSLPPRGTRPVMALRPVSPAPSRVGPPPRAAEPDAEAEAPSELSLALPRAEVAAPAQAPTQAPAGFAAALDAAARADGGPSPDPSAEAAPDQPGSSAGEAPAAARPRDGAARPLAPRPREAAAWKRPAVAAGVALAALAMAGMGFAAYRLRDRPEQVVATRAAAPGAADVSGTGAAGKVAERAAPAGSTDATSADAGGDAAAQPTSGAAVPAPVPQALGGTAAPSIAVAQRAALLVDAPEDPQRVRTYVGTVVWHLDSVSPGGGQPLATAVKADVDIPDAKLKVTMLMQKNPEPQLPASHTIEFHFLPQAGNTLGPIKQVNVPEMRRDDDAPTGDALAGVPVAITENYFLVGLTRGAAETQNIRLITERNWFDMSVLFSSGKLGKLTFEKGAGGQRVIDDALKAWK